MPSAMGTYSVLHTTPSPREAVHTAYSGQTSRALRVLQPETTNDVIHRTEEKRPRLQDSIGRSRLYILVLGTVFILAAIAVLAFLWKGAVIAASQGDPGPAWQSLI